MKDNSEMTKEELIELGWIKNPLYKMQEKTEKQLTAVEWYIKKIKEARQMCDDASMGMDIWHTLDVLIGKGEQAKEMEKKIIAQAFEDGDYNYFYSKKTGKEFENGIEYYNEKFKQQ